jgi:hypothetical protein
MDVHGDDAVYTIKLHIQEIWGVPPLNQHLLFKGKRLVGDMKITDSPLTHDADVFFVFNCCHGGLRGPQR